MIISMTIPEIIALIVYMFNAFIVAHLLLSIARMHEGNKLLKMALCLIGALFWPVLVAGIVILILIAVKSKD